MKQLDSEELMKRIHAYIEQLSYSREPKGLYDPIEYVLALGGKRLRPVLMLLAYNLYREDVEVSSLRRQESRPIITLRSCMMT